MKITRNKEIESVQGPEEYFTGKVRVEMQFGQEAATKAAGALVTFEAGARTAWHTHPAGQTLIITSGLGWLQKEGEQIIEIAPGDVIYFEPDEKHWHGASPNKAMSHLAIQEEINGKVVDWMEKVSDAQYQK
ncbi:cupin domain-containing protein [Mesonia sp.]|uniref:(R)-mandelonitrile lyase n=1 Tax=Mesonia sp. TaxID=1960830 RepID=UPI00175C2F7F|nr:cupin domain-containing protein [Mesonia sp.]HIB36023.1 cupin domain-containing protein [Mesonia sp.]HIO26302.1 cupin domain-containing protein [Flavobacteriaceae bacterium]